jgi:hypothetical protein
VRLVAAGWVGAGALGRGAGLVAAGWVGAGAPGRAVGRGGGPAGAVGVLGREVNELDGDLGELGAAAADRFQLRAREAVSLSRRLTEAVGTGFAGTAPGR